MKKTLSIDAIQANYAVELAEVLHAAKDLDLRYKAYLDAEKEDSEETSAAYSTIAGIAVYKISGPILTSGNEYTRWLGIADYESIRNDMLQASQDPSISEILLLISSPGGSVFGVTDAADAIKKVDSIKPVTVYSNKNVASGAYWLAAAASKLYLAPEAEAGSIGVIVTHASYQGQLENEGVKVTVIKSSELKAVGGPYTDLTDKEINHIQDQVDTFNTLFQDHVQGERSGIKASAMNGATYIGAEAVKVGLADGVMTYDQVLSHIQAQRPKSTAQGGYQMNKEQLRIALDSGRTLEDLGLTQAEVDAIMAEPIQEELPTEGIAETPDFDAMSAELTDLREKMVGFETLQAQIAEKDAKIEELVAELAAVEPTVGKLKGIVAGVLDNRRVALGLVKVDSNALTMQSLLTEYEATSAAYDKAFVEGGLFGLKKQTQATKLTPEPIDSIKAANLRAASI